MQTVYHASRRDAINIARPDRAEWTAAKRIGDGGEHAVAGFFRALGLAVCSSPTGAPHDLSVAGKIEVKTDRLAASTGNVAVEMSYRGRASGLMTTDADSWCIVLGAYALLLPVADLRWLVADLPDRLAGEGAMVRLLPLAVLRAHARICALEGGAR